MAELTYTKSAIRKAIGRASRQEFFLRYGDTGEIIASSDNTTILVNFADPPAITQDSDFWQNQWLYDIAQAQERVIIFSSSGGGIDVETAYSVAASSGDLFEIWGLWPPSIVHDAMDRAMRHAWDIFPNVVISESLILQEDVLRYGLANSDMTLPDANASLGLPAVGEVLGVWLERANNVIYGQVTSTTSATVFNSTDGEFSTDLGVDSDWLISIFDGPCRGQLRQLNSVDTDGVFTADTGWDNTAVGADYPTTDSRFAFWDPSSNNEIDWEPITNLRFDQPTDPDFMYLTDFYSGSAGMRIRLQYLAQYESTTFDTDADVTRVPLEYMVYKTLNLLYMEMVPDNRYDRASLAGLAEFYGQMADDFANREGRPLPPTTIWNPHGSGVRYRGYSDRIDPLDWGDR